MSVLLSSVVLIIVLNVRKLRFVVNVHLDTLLQQMELAKKIDQLELMH